MKDSAGNFIRVGQAVKYIFTGVVYRVEFLNKLSFEKYHIYGDKTEGIYLINNSNRGWKLTPERANRVRVIGE